MWESKETVHPVEVKNLAAKLVKISKACDYVQKDGKNNFHGYKYASAAAVLEKVNAACVENNVASIVNSKILSTEEVITSKGNKERLVTVETTLTLIDADTGETLQSVALGSGQDSGDKAVAKAQTMALKYCWLTTLNISTGDDPEADTKTDEAMHNNKQMKQTKPKPQEDKVDWDGFWKNVAKLGYGEDDVLGAAALEEGRMVSKEEFLTWPKPKVKEIYRFLKSSKEEEVNN